MLEMAIFVKCCLSAKCTGISFVDSTPLRVCKNRRIHIHKTFAGIAARGKCSMGWFYGFKLLPYLRQALVVVGTTHFECGLQVLLSLGLKGYNIDFLTSWCM